MPVHSQTRQQGRNGSQGSRRAILQAAVTRLGVDETFVHVECKWDGRRLRIIEVNSRIGGGSVAKMLNMFLGVDARAPSVA